MLAIFGLGIMEIVILALIGVLIGGVALAIALRVGRPAQRGPTVHDELMDLRAENADLRAENRRLRDELERLRGGSDKKEPPDPGIVAGPGN